MSGKVHKYVLHYFASIIGTSLSPLQIESCILLTTTDNIACNALRKQIGSNTNRNLSYLLTYLLTYLIAYLLAPWSNVFLEKLTGSRLVKKLTAFYGTRRFITATCPYPEPDQLSPCLPSPLPGDPS